MLDSTDMLARCVITLTLDQFGVFKEKFRRKKLLFQILGG